MSDSDSDDLLANNLFNCENESTIVSVKGPNTNIKNITGINLSNVFSSTLQMPRRYDGHRYAASSYDQQSLRNRREISPMSVRSTCEMRQRNFAYSFKPQEMGAPRSAFNGRSGSPMTIRSIGTSASVSAVDILHAINNEQFNKHELKVIKEACQKKYYRHHIRKKMDYRQYRKIHRRISGYDSGEQGSNSSLSSDDRSISTSRYKGNMSGCRSVITDISNFKRKIQRSNMFKDCTNYIRNNSIQNAGPMNWNTTQLALGSQKSMPAGSTIKFDKVQEKPAPVMSLKERFNNGYQLQSQRFNRSIIPTSIPENAEKELQIEMNPQNGDLAIDKNSKRNIESDSDDDEIFSNSTNRKHYIDSGDICLPNQKRLKTLSPCKNDVEARKLQAFNGKVNDFVFTKPICPARKSAKEKLISKCTAPLSETIPQASIMPPEIPQHIQEKSVAKETEKLEDEQPNSTCNSTSLSMRPSFIKRKLFTQKLDVLETRNLSLDNMNSPQNSNNGAIQKEKHKARKLQQATTQSCLNRDIQDESNILDLIKKIVPIDQMNVTSQRNITGNKSRNKNMSKVENNKWDGTTISTRKNDEDLSETYTDEEILNSTVKELQKEVHKEHTTKRRDKDKKNVPKKPSPPKSKNCEKLLEKLPSMLDGNKQSRIKPFWDTDFESDAEFQPSVRTDKLILKENLRPDIRPKEAVTHDFSCTFTSKNPVAASNPSSQNYTFDTTQKFNNTLKIRSHRASKRNKLERNTDLDAQSKVVDTGSKQKNNIPCSANVTNPVSEAMTNTGIKKSKETATKKKSPKGKKQATKTETQKEIAQNPNKKKHDSSKTQAQTTKETNAKKTPQTLNSNSKEQDIVENKANNISNTNKKNVEPNNKSHNNKKTTQKNNPPVIEENNNKSNRSVRSCRINSKNRTAEKSNISTNETMNRTLRSRKQDLSTTANKNNTKLGKKDTKNYILSRISDVSFSLDKENNNLAKRAVRKINNSRLLNVYDSDVSFSLTPTPRKTRAASRNNTLNSTPVTKNPKHKELPISDIRPRRKRTPNVRYMY